MKEQKEQEITYYEKGFIGKILCKHNYESIGKVSEYNGIEEKKADLPTRVYFRYICTKCGKIKRKQMV